MGRIEHRTRIPSSASSVQLHPSIAVVCMAPDVRCPPDSALTSRSWALEYVTAASPSPTSTIPGYGQTCTRAWAPSLWPM
jgi:hypothetical protein